MYAEKIKTAKVRVHCYNSGISYDNEYNSEDMKSLLSAKRISEEDYYWYPGMTEWKRVSEFPFDNPPVIEPSFFERLNNLFIIFWFILHFFLIVLSLYLKVTGFEKNHIVKNDFMIGIPVLLFGYVIIYTLFLSIAYVSAGKRASSDDIKIFLFIGAILQILNYAYILP
jgi:hypothetical protein